MLTDLEKCATYTRIGDLCTISCNKGLWEVSGKFSIDLINQAYAYFNQYKEDGEYSEIKSLELDIEELKDEIAELKENS